MSAIESLWREVYAQPDDDDPRAVLADLLIAAGDPRGELIALQLLPAEEQAARDRQERIQYLLAQHGREWLGPLDDIAIAARFERGCVHALVVEDNAKQLPWDRILADPALAGIETIQGGNFAYRRLIGALPRLRRLEVQDEHGLRALEASTAPIEHIAWGWESRTNVGSPLVGGVVAACKERESIVSIGFPISDFELFAANPWFSRLRSVTLSAGVRRGLSMWSRLPSGCGLVVVPQPKLEPCTVAFPYDYRIELEHTAAGLVARIAGEWVIHPIDALQALPGRVARIEVEHTSDAIAERVRAAVARPGVEVLVKPPRRAGNFNSTRRAG